MIYIYSINRYTYIYRDGLRRRATHRVTAPCKLAFTKYSFTSRLLCTNQPSFYAPRPPALPTLKHHYCTMIGQYKTPLPTSRLYALPHTILAITISCKRQPARSIERRRWLQDTSKIKQADFFFAPPPPSCFPGFTRG